MNDIRAQEIVDKMAGNRKLAAHIVYTMRFPGWDGILAYMDSGKFGKAADIVMNAGAENPDHVADMIWEG